MRKLLLFLVFSALYISQVFGDDYCGIRIVGDKEFISQVKASLELISRFVHEEFANIQRYIGIIEQNKRSGMFAYKKPPKYQMSKVTAFYSLTWCAGTIAHDSYHSKLYHDYKEFYGEFVPDNVWIGREAEAKCLAYQLMVMQKIGAPEYELNYLKILDSNYYDIDRDGDYDKKDYIKRNW